MTRNSTVEWDSEQKRYVILEFAFTITWAEFHEGVREAHDLIAASHRPVGLLTIARGPLPVGNAMTHFRHAFLDQPENTSMVVVVVGSPAPYLERFIQILVSQLGQTFPNQVRKFQIARTIDEGHALLSIPAAAES